ARRDHHLCDPAACRRGLRGIHASKRGTKAHYAYQDPAARIALNPVDRAISSAIRRIETRQRWLSRIRGGRSMFRRRPFLLTACAILLTATPAMAGMPTPLPLEPDEVMRKVFRLDESALARLQA